MPPSAARSPARLAETAVVEREYHEHHSDTLVFLNDFNDCYIFVMLVVRGVLYM